MANLKAHLIQLIKDTGPISLARYMAEALGHPKWGYYTTRDPLGRGGDFITAPEISQMFGELVGLWLADAWQRMGRPSPVRLVELGPGRGTLMVDALRSIDSVAGMKKAIDLHLVETSPVLRRAQEERLEAIWHEGIATLPEGPLLLVANEFFDALPMRQYERENGRWRERRVGLNASEFVLMLGDPLDDDRFPKDAPHDNPKGSIVETCDAAVEIAGNIGAMIARHGGAALVIDYGYGVGGYGGGEYGDTLQAVRGHKYAGIFDAPGDCDLTAHVNFGALAEAFKAGGKAGGAEIFGPIGQGDFLTKMGIVTRATALLKSATQDQRNDIESALARLIDGDKMGTLFKAMAVTNVGAVAPVGFGDGP